MTNGPKPKTHCHRGHEFTPDNTRQLYKDGNKNGRRCLRCSADRISRYRELHPELAKLTRTNSAIRTKFGIDGITGREEILSAQGGSCAVCGRDDCIWGKGFRNTWHIDHDHETKEVRGVLCARCNLLLGHLDDDIGLLKKFISYLEK